MSSKATNFLDLDAVAPEVDLTVKLNGKKHKLKPLSVEDFIKNTQDQMSLSGASNVEDEVNLVLKMLTRAFPTIAEDELRAVPLNKLWKLLEFARDNNGSGKVEDEARAEQEAKASENPPTAG
jgi:hypothetical protein